MIEAIARDLNEHGLILRGGFSFDEAYPAPLLPPHRRAARDTSPPDVGRGNAPGLESSRISSPPSGGEVARRSRDGEGVFDADIDVSDDQLSVQPFKSVLLVGQAGPAPWPHFQRWLANQPADLKDPLDTWSREVIGSVTQRFGARAVSPNDRPYLPFQRWAMRAEGLRPSPLGILMHPRYGLWHAYRGALLFDHEIAIQPPETAIHLCDLCVGKPCLKSCPVDAYSVAGFAYQDCLAHVRGQSGGPCRDGGCLDRNACPYGTDYRYPPEVQAFHMAAFASI